MVAIEDNNNTGDANNNSDAKSEFRKKREQRRLLRQREQQNLSEEDALWASLTAPHPELRSALHRSPITIGIIS